ncbi:hypothetical protein J4227_08025 [Candidatus Woesearchaeota archaeon]|nr:hypothetical protein [Candidatus Woesearchaeota archaeon]
MRNEVITIKMPESLLNELKKRAQKMHYMDLSEEIRSIVRKKWLQYNDPEIMRMKKLKDEIEDELKKGSEIAARRHVLSQLEEIKKNVSRKVEQNNYGALGKKTRQ